MNDYPNRPLIGVGIIVLRGAAEGTEVLLIKRGKPPRQGHWSLPGGRQRLGETVRETAVREVREETGCDVRVTELLDVVDSITRDRDGGIEYHYTLVDFLAEWAGGEAGPQGDAAAAAWVRLNALGSYRLWDETLRLIELGEKRRLSAADPAHRPYNQDHLK